MKIRLTHQLVSFLGICLLAVLAGCGAGSDSSATPPTVPAGETVNGVPYPSGGIDLFADADPSLDLSGQAQLEYPAERADELLGFFEAWGRETGELARREVNGVTFLQVFDSDGRLIAQITVHRDQPPFERDGPQVTFVTIVDATVGR